MPTYSFKDVNAAIVGPGGVLSLSNGAAEEGITITPVEDKNIMQIGAGGDGQHSLIGSQAALVTVTILKTNPINAALQQMYNYQTSSSVLHGKNVITVTDLGRGDLAICREVAFKRQPDLNWQKEAGTIQWQFDAIKYTPVIGVGSPEA
jgi:hypothetical protein